MGQDSGQEPFLAEPPASIRSLAFAVIDLETSGGRPKASWDGQGRFHAASEITEVGVVRLAGTVVQGAYTSLCAIEGNLPPLIQGLTGITVPMLVKAPSWECVALRLAEELEGRVWVAHNAAFDGGFLQAYLPKGLWGRHPMLCTLKLARRLVPEARSRSLGALVDLLGLCNTRPHRALPDAQATAELLRHLIERAESLGWDAERWMAEGTVKWKG